MPNQQVERLAENLVSEVRDEVLDEAWHYFYPSLAPQTTGYAIYEGLVAGLDARKKDLLWKLLAEVVEQTLGKGLQFVDHKRVVGELRVLLCDPDTGAQSDPLGVTGVDSIDLNNEYWWAWLPTYAKVRERPKVAWLQSRADDLPPAVRDAAARDLKDRQINNVMRQVDDNLRTLAFRVSAWGDAGPAHVEYSVNGTRR
jgi:hypothetical protein